MIFDLSTPEILESELSAIHDALLRQEIDIHPHALNAAREENIRPSELLAAILVGRPTEKDLTNNQYGRFAGIAFEHLMNDGRWIKVKVGDLGGIIVITVHTIRR